MSDVQRFYAAVAAKFGVTKKWEELNRDEQVQFVYGVNLILSTCR